MIVELGGTGYFIGLGGFLALTILVGLLLKNKSESSRRKILIIISFMGLALHFLKLLMPKYYNDLPLSLRKITPENICAVSTIIFPFILLSKNKYAKDYMFYMGVISGIASIALPLEAIGRSLKEIDVIRFYICHYLIFIVPFYMVFYGLHKLEFKRVFFFPISFMLVLALIVANEVILMEMGFVDMRGNDFLNYNYRNSSFIFGPTENLKEISDKYVDWAVPKPFKTVMIGEYKGAEKYTPILWLLVPSYVYLVPITMVIYFTFVKVLRRGNNEVF